MWWMYIVVVAVLALGVYGFVTLVRFQTRRFTTRTNRRAEDLYERYADPPPRRHRWF
jgi:hypothetical protein